MRNYNLTLEQAVGKELAKEVKKVKTKGNKGGLVYVDMPTKLNDLPEFLNDYKGTNLNVKIDSLRDYK